jgi:hypothetical protein
MTLFIDLLGWIGAIALLVGYGMVSAGRLQGTSWLYQQLNLGGSVLLIVNTAWHGAFPSAFLNVVWVAIALAAMLRLRKSRIDPGAPPS